MKERSANSESVEGEDSRQESVVGESGDAESKAQLTLMPQSEEPKTPEPLDAKLDSQQRSGVKVRKIGAIFGTSSNESMAEDLRLLSKLTSELSVPFGEVYFILTAIPKNLGMETFEPLKGKGVDVHLKLKVPPEYKNVSSTPTWIISTAKGDVLLEGTRAPADFFNSHGEFVEPVDKIQKSNDQAGELKDQVLGADAQS